MRATTEFGHAAIHVKSMSMENWGHGSDGENRERRGITYSKQRAPRFFFPIFLDDDDDDDSL